MRGRCGGRMTNEARAGEEGQVGSRVGGGRATKLAPSTPVGRLPHAAGLWAGGCRSQNERGGKPHGCSRPYAVRHGLSGAARASVGPRRRIGRRWAEAPAQGAQPRVRTAAARRARAKTAVAKQVRTSWMAPRRHRRQCCKAMCRQGPREEGRARGCRRVAAPHRCPRPDCGEPHDITEQQHQQYDKAVGWAPRRLSS